MNCYPEEQPSYKDMTDYEPEFTKKQVECTCDYLREYSDFASEKRKSDKDVNKLFDKTKQLAAFSIQSESRRIRDEIDSDLTSEGKFEPYKLEDTIKAIQFDMHLIGKLLDILTRAEKAELRIDKILVMERYIDIAHNDAPLIGEACAEKEMNGDKYRNIYTSQVAQETLNCLAERK